MLQLWYWFNKFDVFEKYIWPETKKNTNRSQQSLLVNGRSGNNLARGMLNPVKSQLDPRFSPCYGSQWDILVYVSKVTISFQLALFCNLTLNTLIIHLILRSFDACIHFVLFYYNISVYIAWSSVGMLEERLTSIKWRFVSII